MFTAFLIKYAEIGVKGKNKYLFEEALAQQVKYALKRCEGEFKVTRTEGRIYVHALSDFDYEETVDNLKTVFGISGICPVIHVADEGFEKLSKVVVSYMDETYPDKNMALGEAILNAFPEIRVDVHKPDVMLHVEIREKIYIYSMEIPGPGGMPVGSNGKAMLLLSGGIDSPVAGYMIAKRGVKIDAVYFHAPPYTSDRAKQKVIDLAKQVSRYAGPVYLHIINFTDIQLYIYEKCPHEELTIIMRRYMMKIAEMIAKETGCLGLITGESIGQVASQTVQSLAVTNEVCTLPVFRPLIGFDKMEIVAVSEKIGAYETSILPYEDCCTIFVAKHPVTKPNLNVVKRHEKNLEEKIDELVKQAIDSDEVVVAKWKEDRK